MSPAKIGSRPSFTQAPIATLNGPYACLAGTSVLLSWFGSADPADPIGAFTVTVDPGDGTGLLGPFAGSAGSVPHTYATAVGAPFLAFAFVTSAVTSLMSQSQAAVVSVISNAAVAAVTVEPVSAAGLVGEVIGLTATDVDAAGNPLSGRVDTWTSSAPSVAQLQTTTGDTVSINLLAAGTSNIQATAEGIASNVVVVTVTAVTPVVSVTLTPTSATGPVGTTVGLTATVLG